MGLIVFDAGVLIGFLDRDDAHHGAARQTIKEHRDRRDRLTLPASALAETLVDPSRRGPGVATQMRDVLDRVPIEVLDLSAEIAMAAAGLRAHHQAMKLPDALVIATAIAHEADVLVTTDRRWPTRARLGFRGEIVKL